MEDEQTSKQITGDRTAAGLPSHDKASAGAVRESISDRQKGMRIRGESDSHSGSTADAALNGDAEASIQGGHAPADRAGSQPTAGTGSAEGVSAEDGHPEIGPAGAAPQWRDFYRAIRNAVTDMRSEK